jgi:RNA binding exosome subunit
MSNGIISDNGVEEDIKKYIDEASRIIKKQINEKVECEDEVEALQKLYDRLDDDSKYYVDEQVLRLQIWLKAVAK